jgi:ATP diphosphatase
MTAPDILPLVRLMELLRSADGCPWDREQDFASIAPYTIEEAYEVADAIARADWNGLKEELGDLLLQVVFHARMAEEAGHFALADVIDSIVDKLVRRHPHVFGDASAGDAAAVKASWEAIKAAERSGAASVLDGVALALPALLRAGKLAARAARTGFDWPDASGARAKVLEEIAELDSARSDAERFEEAGDLLFAAASWCRKMGIDAEAALRAANAKFERRFRAIEMAPGFARMSLKDQERLWRQQR